MYILLACGIFLFVAAIVIVHIGSQILNEESRICSDEEWIRHQGLDEEAKKNL